MFNATPLNSWVNGLMKYYYNPYNRFLPTWIKSWNADWNGA